MHLDKRCFVKLTAAQRDAVLAAEQREAEELAARGLTAKSRAWGRQRLANIQRLRDELAGPRK